MMKTRVISGVVGAILLVTVVLLGNEVLGVGVFILALIGMHEFYNAVSNAGYKPVRFIGYIACVPLLVIAFKSRTANLFNFNDSRMSMIYISMAVFLVLFILLAYIVFLFGRYNLNDISLTVFGMLYIAFLFSFVILTRNLENGHLFIWLVFIGAWATDTFAYFTGITIGKTKILPSVSPKKSLEGSIGGVVGCIVAMVVYGIITRNYSGYIPLYHYAVIGLLCGMLSQIGDWAASAIKRYVQIKDFGKIMPGHGGVLDRFDSILFTAPVIYFYLSLIVGR